MRQVLLVVVADFSKNLEFGASLSISPIMDPDIAGM